VKVIGGSFGNEAIANIDIDKGLVVEYGDSEKVIYSPEQIQSVKVEQVKERTFDRTAYIVGLIPSSILCSTILGWYGVLLGAVIAVPCGYWSGRQKVVIIHFYDEKFIQVECESGDMYALKEMKKNP